MQLVSRWLAIIVLRSQSQIVQANSAGSASSYQCQNCLKVQASTTGYGGPIALTVAFQAGLSPSPLRHSLTPPPLPPSLLCLWSRRVSLRALRRARRAGVGWGG
eukprot:scaffold79344_cov25-Tisochrysis_lutea.AAC.1